MNWQDRGSYPRLTYAALKAAGVDADAVFAAVGASASELQAAEYSYPHEGCVEFWAAAERISGDADIGLTVGAHLPSYRGEVLEYLYLSSPDFGTGLRRGIAYGRLISDAIEGWLGEDSDGTFVAARSKSPRVNACRHQSESYLLGMLRFFQEITEGAFKPLRMDFMCAPPANIALREQRFGCPVRYGAAAGRTYFDAALLTRPSSHAQAELFRLTERIAAERLQKIVARDFIAELHQVFGSLLELGEVTLEAVAQQLRLTPAEVRNRLAAAGTSFQPELDDYRHRLACRLLAETAHNMQDVCYLTGFSEPATFYRAFRRWQNDTPVNYRKKHQAVMA